MVEKVHPYACFVSYRGRKIDREAARIAKFVADLEFVVSRRSPDHLEVFCDRDRIMSGDKFDGKLAKELCRSFCMIALWTADYFDKSHDYCMREYRAMEALEEKRLGALGSEYRDMGLIIPVIWCDKDLFPTNKVRRQYVDFTDHRLAGLTSERYDRDVEQLGTNVSERCVALKKHSAAWWGECTKHRMPTSEAVKRDFARLIPEYVTQFDRI